MATLVATNFILLPVRSNLITPVSSSLGLRRIAPDTHMDQARGSTALATALAALPPQKNIGVAIRPRGLSQICGYRYSGSNP